MIGLHQAMSVPYAFALADIVSIGDPVVPGEGKAAICLLKLTGDRSARLLDFEVSDLMLRPVQLLPAEPGTCRVYGEIEEHPTTWDEPVIAWALCVDGQIRIVTPNGVVTDKHCDVHIETPGGSIQGVGQWNEEASFDNRAAYVEWLHQQWVKRQTQAPAGHSLEDAT